MKFTDIIECEKSYLLSMLLSPIIVVSVSIKNVHANNFETILSQLLKFTDMIEGLQNLMTNE